MATGRPFRTLGPKDRRTVWNATRRRRRDKAVVPPPEEDEE